MTARAWSSPGGLLAARPAAPVADGGLCAQAGIDPWCDYLLLGADGEVVQVFTASAWSLEDELGVRGHVVEGDRLIEIVAVTTPRGVRCEPTTRLAGLAPVDDPDTLRWAAAAVRDARAETKPQAASAGDLPTGPIGASLARTHELLTRALGTDPHGLAARTAAALVSVARAASTHAGTERGEGLTRALAHLDRAARLVVFDRTLDRDDRLPTGAAPAVGHGDPLAAELLALGAALDETAEQQDWADARLNASQYRRAAALARAAATAIGARTPA